MRRWCLVLACIACGVALAAAPSVPQATGAPRAAPRPAPLSHAIEVPARQVVLRLGVDRVAARARGAVTLIADVTPRPGMHVYAPGQPEYESVSLQVARAPWYTVGKVAYPPGVDLFLQAVKQRVQVYEASFRVTAPLTLGPVSAWPAATSSGTLTATGTLAYQACDAKVCYRPESVKLTWMVGVAR